MSSDPRSDAPSPEPEQSDAELIRERGADLLAALEARLPGATSHAEAAGRWALAIAAELRLTRETALAVRETARLHAIGQLYAETADAGCDGDPQADAAARLAGGAGLPDIAVVWLAHWRERFDGAGPKRLYGGAIPLESRTVRAACAYAHELESEPDPERALERLGGRAGTELDPATIGAIAFVLDARNEGDPRPD
jgi:HD-GYP domain-containing protein (c-di-GMP phosphodiesterase class II)